MAIKHPANAIRPATQADFSGIERIYALSKLDELQFEDRVPTLLPLADDPKRLPLFRASSNIVYETDEIAAYGGYLGQEIRSLYVHPRYRGIGIGTALLRYMLEQIAGDARLTIATRNTPARMLYEREGFTVINDFWTDYNGEKVLASEMLRTVG